MVRLFDLADHLLESNYDIRIQSRTGLREAAVTFICELSAFVEADLSLIRLQIAFVANDHQRYPVRALIVLSRFLQWVEWQGGAPGD